MKTLSALALISSPGLASAALSGSFSILALNVAGLPAILNGNEVPGDKAENTEIIGERFVEYGYDLIQVQEDFNYHAYLYNTATLPYRTATSGGVPFGSGLNTLANYDWIDFERVKWDVCENASGADCLTPKGFTVMRVQIDEGVYVDAYNLHTDAGSEAADITARAKNLQQVADYIDTNSVGNAVLVFGDTNARYTRTGDGIRVLETQNRLVNPWVELILNGVEPVEGSDAILCDNPSNTSTCETVDKIFYRGSRALTLQATAWSYESEKFLNNGSILSDHNPVSSTFSWTRSNQFRTSDLYGGPHGTWFNDLPSLPTTGGTKLSKISLRGANRLDGITLALSTGATATHGGTGGTLVELELASDEYWTGTRLCQGKYDDHTRIFYITVTTSTGNTLVVGTETDECVEYTAESGWQVLGVYGRDGDEVDRLGVVYGVIN